MKNQRPYRLRTSILRVSDTTRPLGNVLASTPSISPNDRGPGEPCRTAKSPRSSPRGRVAAARKGKFKPLVLPPGFETFDQAKSRRAKCIAHLRRSTTKGARALARRLAACKSGSRCGSGACAVCMRKVRMRWTKVASRFLAKFPLVLAVAIIPKGSSRAAGALDTYDLLKAIRSHQRALQRWLDKANLPYKVVVIGGLDLSLNTWENADPTWFPHFHLLVGCMSASDGGRAARDAIQGAIAGAPVLRAFHSKVVSTDKLAKATSYTLKSVFGRRSAFGRRNELAGKRKPRPAWQPIRGQHLTELLVFLDAYRPLDRFLLKGVRREGLLHKMKLRRL